MQVIVEERETRRFLHDLARALGRDAHSWKGWRIFISPAQAFDGMQQGRLTTSLSALLSSYDGAVVWAKDLCLAIYNQDDANDDAAAPDDMNEFMSYDLPLLMAYDLSDSSDRAQVLDLIGSGCNTETCGDNRPNVSEHLKDGVPRFEELLKMWERTSARPCERIIPNIMVVDDDAVTRHIISSAMQKNHRLLMAQNVAEAVRKHILFTPDIVFLDIDLPDFDGYVFLDHVRRYDAICRVIMFSGNSSLANRLRAFAAGADGFIPKPFRRHIFENYITDWSAHDGA